MVKKKKKEKKNITTGIAHINSSFNNTKVLISDVQGNAIAWSSSGTMGFKGSRKATPYAAQLAAEDAGKKAQEHGMKSLDVHVQGPGSGRESALRALSAIGMNVTSIKDVTPIVTRSFSGFLSTGFVLWKEITSPIVSGIITDNHLAEFFNKS